MVMAVMGKAGSGKTMLLAGLYAALKEAGVEVISADWEGRRRKDRRTLAILAPTNKAASVLRLRGVPATTIHRILYTPVYDPEYEKIAEWLAGQGPRPTVPGLTDQALDRAQAFFQQVASIPGALAAAGLKGSDFIKGWKRREDPLDVGFVDEASMLDERQFEDLREIFPRLVLFGDPAQLAPVGQSGEMVFDRMGEGRKLVLSRIHRQAQDNPILDLAHALGDPGLGFEDFEALVQDRARRDDRVVWAERVDADLMARSPVLVWRNVTRVKLITAFRTAQGCPGDDLMPGEPLICDGIELPLKHRKKRIDLEARGLIKGAQVIYLGPGSRPGLRSCMCWGRKTRGCRRRPSSRSNGPRKRNPSSRMPPPWGGLPARRGGDDPQGARLAMARSAGLCPRPLGRRTGRAVRSRVPLWKRLAYVAITRAETRLYWVVRNRLALPRRPLGVEDLKTPAAPLALDGDEG